MANNQAYIFMVFTIVGVIIGVLFDIFRILRKTFKTKDIVTYIEDIVFWLITGMIIVYAMYVFCDGELRFFMILGIIIGATMYMLTISKYVIMVSVFLINIVKKVLIYPVMLILRVAKKVIFRPIMFICINIRKNILQNIGKKISQNVKKMKKFRGILQKKEKYNSI